MKTTDTLLDEVIESVSELRDWAQADAEGSWESDAHDQAVDDENRVKILDKILVVLSYCYKGV